MNKECISVFTYLTAFVLFLPKRFFNEVIMVETNRIIKGPDLDFGQFLHFIWIWLLITANPDTNRAEYFSKKTIFISMGAQFVSTILCLVCFFKLSDLLSSLLSPPSLPFDVNFMNYDILLLRLIITCKKSLYRLVSHSHMDICTYG